LLITDYKTGETGLTLAAALIFGKDTTIHSILPGYKVEAMVRIENKDRWDDRLTLRTNLIDTYLQLMDFIMKQKSLPGRFHLEGDQRIDLKNIIFREVIGNIIVHREYTNTLATELLVYSDKVTATNPNRANYRGPLDINTFTPYAKNPNIRKFFTTFGWTDEIGSGVRNVTKYLKFYVPGASPRFIEDDVFRTEIPLSVVTFYSISESLIKVLELNVEMREQVEEAFRILPVNEELHDAVTIKTVQNLVSVWHTNGQRMKQLGWPKLAFTKTAEEKDKSLHKKILQYIQILLFSFVAASMDRLMDLSGYESRTSFRNIYIKPLLEAGLLLRTIPDKPNSPHQQYVISKKGKNFLSGYAI
jgi:ATP-dependent DNA helicase RecG